MNTSSLNTTDIAKNYYNSCEADEFYYNIWGGEDIHIGIYKSEDESIFKASRRTVEMMASKLGNINQYSNILDIGSGYGGAARYLVNSFGCKVYCLNLSEVENERNREKNHQANIHNLIEIVEGSFEEIPFDNSFFDIVWSEDAILHSGNRYRVLNEVYRVLTRGGDFIFTDPMQSDKCPKSVLQPVLDRIHLDSMGSFSFYRCAAESMGFDEISITDLSEHLPVHYTRVQVELHNRYNDMVGKCGKEYVDNMLKGLSHWITAGERKYLRWGIMHFRKK